MKVFSGKPEKDSGKEGVEEEGVPRVLPESLLDKAGFSGKEQPRGEEKKPVCVDPPPDSNRLPEELAVPGERVNRRVEREDVPPLPRRPGRQGGVSSGAPSFFEDLERRYREEKVSLNAHVVSSSDLVKKMRVFHESRMSGKEFFLHEGDVDAGVYKKLLELKEMEDEWLLRLKEFDAAKALLFEKEVEIEAKIEDFKRLLKGGDLFKLFYKHVSGANAFRLSNGVFLFSLADLRHALLDMPDSVFHFHVSGERNDFASWILHVFGEEELAERVRRALSRDAMLRVLSPF